MVWSSKGVREMRKIVAVVAAQAALGVAALASGFTVYEGNSATEAAWRAAAGGNVPLEDFEGFANATCCPCLLCSDQVKALPALGVVFASDVADAYPGIYINAGQAHSGQKQLANFGGGLSSFADYRMHPVPGKSIFALGFWQCDPQGDETLVAFDASDQEVGRIVGRINNGSGNSFAGFVSTVAIKKVVVLGAEGDGWNHIDDLQVVARASCVCDLNGDGFVEDADFVIFVAAYNVLDCADPTMVAGCPADFNQDGSVDDADFVAFIPAYNELVCP